jgi:hypothetical protein
VPAVEYVHASRRTRSPLPRRPSKHPRHSSLSMSYPMQIRPLHRCHHRYRQHHCHLRYPTRSRVSMWHPTTAQRVCHLTRLPTRDSNSWARKTHHSTNNSVSEPLYRSKVHHPWCHSHIISRSQSHNTRLPRIGCHRHQQNLALSRTSQSGRSHLLQPKSRHVPSQSHLSLALLTFFPDLCSSLHHA